MSKFSKLKDIKESYFLSQPHQPFFLLAFVNAIISMVFFAILYGDTYAKYYHAYSLIYLVFTPAFLAFLFTTFPRFSTTEPIAQHDYLRVLMFYTLGSVITFLGIFISIPLLSTGIFLTFIGHIVAINILIHIYKISPHKEKFDQLWILVAMSCGLFAHFTFLITFTLQSQQLYLFSTQVAIYLYLFLLIFTVAQRMVPFFSNTPIEKHIERFKVIVGLLGLHILLEITQRDSSFLVDFLLSYLFARELKRWKLPFPNENPMLWVLHIALFWIPIAFLISSITSLLGLMHGGSSFLYLGIHSLALGFFLTMLIGFGTRVTIGHSGNVMIADNYTKYLFYGTQIVAFFRILTSITDNYMIFFQLSVTTWLILFVAWGYRFFAVLIFGKKLKD